MRVSLQIGILLLFLLGCKDQTSQPLPLNPYERWKTLGLHSYTIDQARVCFCLEGGQNMRIVVRSDTVVSVTKLSDGSTISFPISSFYLTVDSLFSLIRNSESDSLGVAFNIMYGYPEHLDINPQLHPVDGGVLYQTSNLRVP